MAADLKLLAEESARYKFVNLDDRTSLSVYDIGIALACTHPLCRVV